MHSYSNVLTELDCAGITRGLPYVPSVSMFICFSCQFLAITRKLPYVPSTNHVYLFCCHVSEDRVSEDCVSEDYVSEDCHMFLAFPCLFVLTVMYWPKCTHS